MITRSLALPPDVLEKLKNAVGTGTLLTTEAELRTYECDGLTAFRVRPAAVALPRTTEQVANVLRVTGQFGIPVVARGAGTGLSGGSLPLPGCVVVGLARMTSIIDIDIENERMRVQPGVINLDISKALEPHGYYYAPDPSSQLVCTIGGNVAENSGGAHCLKYGFTTHHVLAATAVLSSGEIVTMGSAHGDPLGYDLMSVLVGSEGMLAVVTEVVVRILRKPQATRTFFATFPSTDEAGEAVSRIIGAGIVPAAVEMMDRLAITAIVAATHVDWPDVGAALLMDVDGPLAEVEHTADAATRIAHEAGATEIRRPRDDAERALMWKGRKGAFAAMGRISPNYYVQDGVIPRSEIARVLREIAAHGAAENLRVANVFHAGDGNLHPLVLYDGNVAGEAERAERVAGHILETCIKYGGSITGEHGVGSDKAAYMGRLFNEDDLSAMNAVRCAFDPQSLLNPGKVFPTPRLCGDRPGPYTPHRAETSGLAALG